MRVKVKIRPHRRLSILYRSSVVIFNPRRDHRHKINALIVGIIVKD